MDTPGRGERGFTLIELSIVLVVIGPIVGGVLVGQDLIRASQVRATITQVEKFNTAANTFFEKCGYLPGDIPAVPAAQFGFIARGSLPGQGDGNGLLQGYYSTFVSGITECEGENAVFWIDLSTANLIEGSFSTANSTTAPSNGNITGSGLNNWYPPAKLGQGNYFYAFSPNGTTPIPGIPFNVNYFGLSNISALFGYSVTTTPGLTVKQAYDIDKKIDDGLPMSGNVHPWYVVSGAVGLNYAAGGGNYGTYPGNAAPASAMTCYDNGGVGGGMMQYSVEVSNGANVNCALSFKMQAGD